MRKYLVFLFLIASIYASESHAQESRTLQKSIGYYGNYLINPGLNFTIYKPLTVNEQFLGNILSGGIGQASLQAQADAGFYWDPFSHTGIHVNWGLNYRQFLGRFLGFQIGVSPGIHTNLVSDVYKENRKGEIVRRPMHADIYFAPKISLGTFLSNRSKTHQVFGIFHMILYSRFNSSLLPSLSYEVSYTF